MPATDNSNYSKLSETLSGTNCVCDIPEKRFQMIALVAYFRAEKRGFSPNNDLEDWLESESEVDRHLNSFSS